MDQANLLHQVTCCIHGSLDQSDIQHALVQQLCCALEGDYAGLLMYDPGMQTVTIAAAYARTQSLSQEASDVPVGLALHLSLESEYGSLPKNRDPWVVRDVETAHISEAERLLLQTARTHSLLMVPIVWQGMWMGTAYVGQTDACRLWAANEISLAKLIAEQAAIALHNAQHYADAQRRAQREQVLNCIAQRIRTSLDIDTTINTALKELLTLTQADALIFATPSKRHSTVFTLSHRVDRSSNASHSLMLRSVRHEAISQFWQEADTDADAELDLETFGDRFLAGLDAQSVMAIANTQSSEITAKGRAHFQQHQIGAWLSASVWYQDRLFGHLIAVRPQPHRWSADECAALDEVANQLAIAISHRRLYAATQRQAERSHRQSKRLAQTLRQLYATQSQLIQTEKMSSLGQMVAGIAHEINNPINFIQGNIPYIARYIDDLISLVTLYQTHFPEVPDAIADLATSIELDFVKADLPKILNSMRAGASRVSDIVSTLRNFSRLNEAERKSVDLHEGIESALLLLKHRLKPHIKVTRHYSELPLIDSYPGQLNQALMNILNNAIDAVNDSHYSASGGSNSSGTSNSSTNSSSINSNDGTAKSSTSQITISTRVLPKTEDFNRRVQVRIRDTGNGIDPAHHSKIFDPFFTTKPVGTGTGLGLSISYRIIVEKHGGRLWFEPADGGGTEFVIELPVHQSYQPSWADPYLSNLV
ncbi:MAG TPA: ATP-binding protein [Chroococcidiopsis sp.]